MKTNQSLIAICFAAVMAFVFSISLLFNHISPEATLDGVDANYEMPRPKSYWSWFSLKGRFIQRVIEGDEDETAEVAEAAQPVTVAAKDDKTKKAKDDKAKKAAQTKKAKQLKVSVTDTSRPSSLSKSEVAIPVLTPEQPYIAQAVNEVKEPVVANEEAKEPRKTYQDWKNLLAKDKNINGVVYEILKSYKDKQMSSDEFYRIVSDLLASNDDYKKKMGLYLIQNDISSAGQVYLATHDQALKESFPQDYAKLVASYEDVKRINVVVSGLYSKNEVVLTFALERLKSIVTKIKQLSAANDSEEGSAQLSSFSTPKPLKAFIPALTYLLDAGTTHSNDAQSALSDIQSLLEVQT